MEKKFLDSLRRLVHEPEKARFLLAVSGGMDSTALAHLFYRSELTFDMAHCNFHLREEESDEDMQFVMELSVEYHCTLHLKEFFGEDFLKKKGESVEMIARELRYQWFDELAENYDYLVTAHQADDNAETLLLNLVRGTGLRGITGIPPVNGKIIRPMLNFTSEEIAAYHERNNLTYRIDRTNQTEFCHRNKIRHSVLPVLKELNENVIVTFGNNIRVLREQYDFYEDQMGNIIKDILTEDSLRSYISIDRLTEVDHGRLVLYEMLRKYHFNASTVTAIWETIHKEKEPGRKFFSPSHLLVKDRSQLIITTLRTPEKTPVKINSIEELEDHGFTVETVRDFSFIDFSGDNSVLYIEAEKLIFPLTLRLWRAGDYFYPLGMKGKKKISDLFTDLKIDLLSKHSVPLLCSGNDIIWVVGYRSDNRYRIQDKTNHKFYKITYHGISKPL